MRQLATIQKIAEISPIEGADKIEKARINDWWCVVKKGEFTTGDLAIYFEIDSLLPSDNEIFSFLEKGTKKKVMNIGGNVYTGYRLKTIRLRGQVSQGLALPISSLPFQEKYAEGDDVSEIMGIVKYEQPIPAVLSGKVKGNFPGFLPKTDEERVQNIGDVIERHKGEKFYITEKIDGSSMTVFKKDGVLGVCSRNLELLETEGNSFWKMARLLELEDRIPDGIAIQGELFGEGIQQNPLKLQGLHFRVYNVYDFLNSKYLNFTDMRNFCEIKHLETVPIISENYILTDNTPEIIAMADGNSRISEACKREGLVFRPLVEKIEAIRGSMQRLSFKAISNEYLLAEKE